MPAPDDARDRTFESRLEAELIERHGALYGRRRSAAGAPRGRRLALALAAVLLGIAAASATPARVTLGMGHLVTIDLPAGAPAPGQDDLLVHLLDARTGADQASASVESSPERGDRVLLLLFGGGVATESLRVDLERAFPALAAGHWRIRALEADFQMSLARALGHRVLAIEPDDGALERRRRLILDRLATEGWREEVSFEQSDGIRSIEVHTEPE